MRFFFKVLAFSFVSIATLQGQPALSQDIFETHDKLMISAIIDGSASKVKALLETPYILEENGSKYA